MYSKLHLYLKNDTHYYCTVNFYDLRVIVLILLVKIHFSYCSSEKTPYITNAKVVT